MSHTGDSDAILAAVDAAADEMVEFAAELIRVPTVNPPGSNYRDCAELVERRLSEFGFATSVIEGEAGHLPALRYPTGGTGPPNRAAPPDGRWEAGVPLAEHPRVNVLARRAGNGGGPGVHLNGHMDVVPAGTGWSVDPFGGIVRDGYLYGRGSADMKAGFAAAVYAAEALRRAGVSPNGPIEISATADEESGGFAGVAHLCEAGLVSAARTPFVIIPEPLNVDRICLGHRGVYWFKITVTGRVAHGSTPFLGVSAIDGMAPVLERVRTSLARELDRITTGMPVVPEAARKATINVNSIVGGQAGQEPPTPCVADRCEAVFDLRFPIEADVEKVKRLVAELVESARADAPDAAMEISDLLLVEPTLTSSASPVVVALQESIRDVLGRDAELVASPGTYDQKHFSRIAGIRDCVAYGPGRIEQAHQVDERCAVRDIVDAAKVIALALSRLVGGTGC